MLYCSCRSFSSNSSTSSSSMILSTCPELPITPPMFFATCYLSLLISSWNCLKRASFGSSLIFTSFFIFFALFAYFNVERLSSKLYAEGPILAIITVLVLPPKESCKRRVSWESLYGTWVGLELTKFWMTKPRVVRDKLMLIACYLSLPDTPVFDCL